MNPSPIQPSDRNRRCSLAAQANGNMAGRHLELPYFPLHNEGRELDPASRDGKRGS